MSNLDLGADLSVEGGVSPLSLFTDAVLKLHVGINDLAQKIQKANDLEQRRYAILPNYVPLSRASVNATTTDVLDFDGPQPGRMWIVRLLTAFARPLAANASVVSWYVGQRVGGPQAGMLEPSDLVWQFSSVPGFQSFTADVIKIYPGQHLIAALTGIPASSIISVNARVNDQPLANAVAPVTAN